MTTFTLPTYSTNENIASWGGQPIEGFSEDSSFTISMTSPMTSSKVGLDGRVATTLNADETGTVTFSLMQSSISNQVLSSVVKYTRQTNEIIKADFEIKTSDGLVTCVARNAHIQDIPDQAAGSEAGMKEWVFFADYIEFTDVPTGFETDTELKAIVGSSVEGLKKLNSAIKIGRLISSI